MLCQTRHIFLVWTVEYCDRQCRQREQEAACRSVLHQIDNVNRGRVRKITIVYMLQFKKLFYQFFFNNQRPNHNLNDPKQQIY